MKKIFFKNCYKLFIVGTICFFALPVYAARFNVEQQNNRNDTQGLIQVDIILDSESENINTISGSLVYDRTMLAIDQISTGNSAVSFWVNTPKENSVSKTIDFSGIIPGGVIAKHVQLFSVFFHAQQSGVAKVSLVNTEAFLNDGQGTRTQTSSGDLSIAITGDINNVQKYVFTDMIPPEKFLITRIRNQALFDNKWTIVFAAQDKGSGIANYQVCEYFFTKCVFRESPAVLDHQSEWYALLVRAFDRNNNSRSTILISPRWMIVVVSIFFLSVFSIVLRYVVHYRNRKKNK